MNEELLILAEFLKQQQPEIVAQWMDSISKVKPPSSPREMFSPSFGKSALPSVIKYLLQHEDELEWLKETLQPGYIASIPFPSLIRSQFIIRDLIIQKLKEFQFRESWQPEQLEAFISLVTQAVDQQVLKTAELYITALSQELEEFGKKYKPLAEWLPAMLYSYSLTEGFTFVSRAVERLLGISPKDLYSKGMEAWAAFIHPEDEPVMRLRLETQLQEKVEAEYEYRIFHKNKRDIIYVIHRSIPVLGADGELICIEGLIMDITHQKKMEHQLRMRNKQLEYITEELRRANLRLMQIDRRKSELVNIVAHDLRNPLNSIRLFTELLLLYKNTPEEYEEFLHKIDSESLRLTNLIDNFLDIEKIESGLASRKNELVKLEEVIQHFLSMYHWEAEQRKIAISVKYANPIPAIRGDKHRIEQIFSNLLSNALKCTPDNGKISVNLRLVEGTRKTDPHQSEVVLTQPKHVKVAVKNTGPGINKKFHQKIFEKFFQIDETVGHQQSGTGLGLAIAKQMTEYHGGRIWVESEEGKGTTFIFTLPVEEE